MNNNSDNIIALVQKIQSVQAQAVELTLDLCYPAVDQIISSKITDCKVIEQTLDIMLDTAFDEKVLILYKKLCRYYYFIDPQAAVSYVEFYREMWDSEPVCFSNEV